MNAATQAVGEPASREETLGAAMAKSGMAAAKRPGTPGVIAPKLGSPVVPFTFFFFGSRFPYTVANPRKGALIL